MRGGAARFEQLLEAARKARDRTEKRRLLEALGGFRDPQLAKRAFELVRSKEFDLRDAAPIIYGLLAGHETHATALELVKIHIDELLGRMRDDEASWFLGALAESPCDAASRASIAELVVERAKKRDGAQLFVTRGLELHQAHSVSVWDGLIVQAALDAGCDVLLSEDLQHGRRFGSLEVANPFLPAAAHETPALAYGRVKAAARSRKARKHGR